MILSTDNVNSLQPAAIKQELTNIQHLNIHDDNPILEQHSSPPPTSTPNTTSSSTSSSTSTSASANNSQDHLNNNTNSKDRKSPELNSKGALRESLKERTSSPNLEASKRSTPPTSSTTSPTTSANLSLSSTLSTYHPLLHHHQNNNHLHSSHHPNSSSLSTTPFSTPSSSGSSLAGPFPSSLVFPSLSYPSRSSSPPSFRSSSTSPDHPQHGNHQTPSNATSKIVANMIMQQIQPEPENLHMSAYDRDRVDRDRDEVDSYRDHHSSGGVSPPPSPPHLSPSPTLPTMLGNSLGGGPPPLPPTQSSPHSPPPPPSTTTPTSSSTSSSSSASNGVNSLASLHHALHGLHSLQNLQNQMAALAGLQGGTGLGLAPPPPSPAPPPPHGGVSSLLHLHQTGNSLGGGSPAATAAAAAVAVAATSAAGGAAGAAGGAGGAAGGSMPQMVLTSGQVFQGVQGAQLLIPTSQGVAIQPILTITLGQAGTVGGSNHGSPGGLGSTLNQLHHLHPSHQPTAPPPPQPHHNLHSGGSSASSPLPTSSSSSTSPSSTAPHPLLGLAAAGLPPSLFHPHHNNNNNSTTNNNNNNSVSNNNRSCTPEKQPKLPLSMPSPVGSHDDVQDLPYRRYPSQHDFHTVGSLQARLGGAHFPGHPPPPPPHQTRYSPDFLDTHNQPTISQAGGNMVDGVNLDEIKEFAKAFKIRRLSLGLTQTQVGQALSITEGPAYSQSAICRYKNGGHTLTDFMGNEPTKKRKRRTSFTPQALEILNSHFERNTHPSGAEITAMAEQLGYEREVVRIWFCNKRQALKNTVRMMAKSNSVPPPSQGPPPPPPLPPHSQIN